MTLTLSKQSFWGLDASTRPLYFVPLACGSDNDCKLTCADIGEILTSQGSIPICATMPVIQSLLAAGRLNDQAVQTAAAFGISSDSVAGMSGVLNSTALLACLGKYQAMASYQQGSTISSTSRSCYTNEAGAQAYLSDPCPQGVLLNRDIGGVGAFRRLIWFFL